MANIEFSEPVVLTKWNIGDVMYGPRDVEIDVSALVDAANVGANRAIRNRARLIFDKIEQRGKNG